MEKREERDSSGDPFTLRNSSLRSDINLCGKRERERHAGRLFCPKRGVKRRDGEAGAEEEEQESKGERQERKKKREKGDHFVPTFQRKRSLK